MFEAEYGGHDQIDLYDDVISPSANNGDAPEDRDYMDSLPPSVGDDPHSLARCLGKVKLVPQEEAHEQHFHLVTEVGAVFQVPFQVEIDSLDQQGQEGHHLLSQLDKLPHVLP
ncbi:hypothetical protein DV515_00004497 [Chloebia gouldiae]|uniref:Uncharacterized protein n=1 Tax=Chloebia gouldiae TaxID=44316 RepID=A0A3L8SRH1_CHLGU|nr:hypothetical protein DV515_00004497 [Chloebia gouldiae]